MKKLVIIALVGVLAAGAAGVGVREAGVVNDGAAKCQAPLTFLSSDQTAAVQAIDAYITANVAAKYKHPDQLNWTLTAPPAVKPGHVSLALVLGEEIDPFGIGLFLGASRQYRVDLVRECADGPFKVVEFKLIAGQKPEPLAGKVEQKGNQ